MIGHHRRPHYVPPETRAAATVLTDAFAMRCRRSSPGGSGPSGRPSRRRGRLVRSLTRSDDFVSALTGGTTTLLDLFDATGAASSPGIRRL